MKFNVYSVYDVKSKEFSAPFMQREGAVLRSLEQIVKQSPIPAVDLKLYFLGEFDSETGLLTNVSKRSEGFVSKLLGMDDQEVKQ